MNDGDQALSLIYLVGCLVLVASGLFVRRLPLGQTLKMALAWLLIFAALFAIVALRHDFLALGQRIMAEVTGSANQRTQGGELRIRRADDGHFWAEAEVDGRPLRFMIDSGATATTLSASAARSLGIEPSGGPGVMVDTANGTVLMQRGSITSFRVGPIERANLSIHIAPSDMVNVIGMNFLSSLAGWGVEGDVLVLRP